MRIVSEFPINPPIEVRDGLQQRPVRRKTGLGVLAERWMSGHERRIQLEQARFDDLRIGIVPQHLMRLLPGRRRAGFAERPGIQHLYFGNDLHLQLLVNVLDGEIQYPVAEKILPLGG